MLDHFINLLFGAIVFFYFSWILCSVFLPLTTIEEEELANLLKLQYGFSFPEVPL